MKIVFFILVAIYGHAGHKELAAFTTHEDCIEAERIVEQYVSAQCIPILEGNFR